MKSGLVRKDWKKALPNQASPNHSTILFLVRKGNPKNIKDWSDLVRDDVAPIIPNPKTSGNGRYSYLGAWAYALHQPGGNNEKAKAFVSKFLHQVPVLDTGGRGATTTFVQNKIGDVLLTFESEVYLAVKELGPDQFDIVIPSVSILADNPVAVVDKVVDARKTRKEAQAYLEYLFSEEGQKVAVANYLRPSDEKLLKANATLFPEIELYSVDKIFGGWEKAIEVHFADGALFDQIYQK